MEWYYADEFDQQHPISDGGLAGLVAACLVLDGLALAGLICGYLSLVVLAFIIVVYGFVIIAAIAGSASL